MKTYENGSMKKCSKCGCCYTHPDITFYKDKQYIDGLRTQCISCISETKKKKRRVIICRECIECGDLIQNNYQQLRCDKCSKERTRIIQRRRRRDDNEYKGYQDRYRIIHREETRRKARERIERETPQEREKRLKPYKEYRKTPNRIRSEIRRRSKERGLGAFIMFFDIFPGEEDIEIDYHHQNHTIIVPLPRKIHNRYNGNKHKKWCNKWIKHLYMLDIDDMLDMMYNRI